jgi:hypothetical protein
MEDSPLRKNERIRTFPFYKSKIMCLIGDHYGLLIFQKRDHWTFCASW